MADRSVKELAANTEEMFARARKLTKQAELETDTAQQETLINEAMQWLDHAEKTAKITLKLSKKVR